MLFTAANDMARTQSSPRKLAVVAVTYNSADTVGGLLDSLRAGLEGLPQTQIIIADNASSDATVAIVEAHPIGALVIRTGRNGGYAAGINAALAHVADDADLLVLNPDIRLSPGAAARLVAPLRHPRIGIAAPRIRHENGALFCSLRREPTLQTAWADALLGSRLGSGVDRGESICNTELYETPGIVDWASGAILAVSAEARRRIGPWDESFFLYSEEVDFQRRARQAGFHIAYVPEAEVVHFGGDYHSNPRLYSILTANRLRDYARHHDALSTWMFRLAVLAGEALRSLGGSPVHRAGLKAALRPLPAANIGGRVL